MQIKKRFYAAFLVVLLTASSLLIFICLNILSTHETNPLVPIPKDTKWMVRMDAESYIKEEVYSTLFTEKDDAFIQQIRDIYDRNTNEESNKKQLYLDIKEDIVLYSMDRGDNSFLVIAVQTMNADAFSSNIMSYCKPGQGGAAKNHCGLFIHQLKGKKLPEAEVQLLAQQILNTPFRELQKAAPEKNEFIAFKITKFPENSSFSSMDLSIRHQDRKINLEGAITYPEKLHPGLKFGLKPSGLYIFSRFVPQSLPDTLLSFLPKGLPHLKDIEGYAVDFNGTYLEDPKDSIPSVIGFLPTPVINLVVQTKNPCKVEDLWKAFPHSVRRENLTLDFGNTIFHLKQLAPNVYFIGVDPQAVIPHSGNEVFFIKGHLEKTTKVYGSTFVTAFIENMGPVKALNDFLNSSESINIEVLPKKGTSYAIKGQIHFKQGKQPLHELSKMIFGLHLLD